MKLWKKLLLGLMGFIALTPPAQQRIEQSIVLRGKPEDVFNLVATLKRWPEWTAWTTNRFPDMTMNFEGPPNSSRASLRESATVVRIGVAEYAG